MIRYVWQACELMFGQAEILYTNTLHIIESVLHRHFWLPSMVSLLRSFSANLHPTNQPHPKCDLKYHTKITEISAAIPVHVCDTQRIPASTFTILTKATSLVSLNQNEIIMPLKTSVQPNPLLGTTGFQSEVNLPTKLIDQRRSKNRLKRKRVCC